MEDRTICVVCAWRKDCSKNFFVDGATTTKCPDFTRDVTLEAPEREKKEEHERESNS